MARDFGRVRTAFWSDDKVIDWPERLKFVALYLLTSPHTNAIGMFRSPAQYMAADTGLTIGQIRDALADLETKGFLRFDPVTSHVFLRKYLEHNKIENAKVGTHCIRLAMSLPQSIPFLKEFEAALIAALAEVNVQWIGYRYAIDTVSKGASGDEIEKIPEVKKTPAKNPGHPVDKNDLGKKTAETKETRYPIDTLSKSYRIPEPEPEPLPEPRKEDSASRIASDRFESESPLDLKKELWRRGVSFLKTHGIREKDARSLLGKWRKSSTDFEVLNALAAAEGGAVSDPISYIAATLNAKTNHGKSNGKQQLSDHPLGIFGELADELRGKIPGKDWPESDGGATGGPVGTA